MLNCSKQTFGEYEFEESPNVSDIRNYSVEIKFNPPGFFNLGRHIKSLYEPKIKKINVKIDGMENIQESIFKLLEKYVEDNEDRMFISPHKITVSESKKNVTGQRMVKYTVVALDEDCYENTSETTEDGKRLSYTKREPVNKPIKHPVTSQDEIDKLLSKGGKIEREYWATLDFSRSVDSSIKESDIIPELMKLFPEDEIKDIYIENIGNSFIKNRELRQDESTENKNILSLNSSIGTEKDSKNPMYSSKTNTAIQLWKYSDSYYCYHFDYGADVDFLNYILKECGWDEIINLDEMITEAKTAEIQNFSGKTTKASA